MGMITLFSFALSVMAAVLAIDMYALLRTGEFGPTWRVLIIASVMFALAQALRMADYFDWKSVDPDRLVSIVEMAFALCLAYAFYLQRQAFGAASKLRRDHVDRAANESSESFDEQDEAEDEDFSHESMSGSWARRGGIYRDRTDDEPRIAEPEDAEDLPRP
jgi:hypothetical protein